VELGNDAKYAMKGERTISFQLELGGLLEAHDVLYVPLTANVLMYLASDRYFHIGLVSSMWKSPIMPLRTLGSSLYELIIKVNDLFN
jgi:hypothetical protein